MTFAFSPATKAMLIGPLFGATIGFAAVAATGVTKAPATKPAPPESNNSCLVMDPVCPAQRAYVLYEINILLQSPHGR
jgi:hypothetical protein